MARPLKEGLDYFPHDTDASNDEKIEALRALYGNDGYAFYFILLERIYRTPNSELDVSDTETLQILAGKVGAPLDAFNKMLETALKKGCFDARKWRENAVLTSNGIKKRAKIVLEKRQSMRERYEQKGVSSPVSDTETTPVSDAETTPETRQSKVKESKVNNVRKEVYKKRNEMSAEMLSYFDRFWERYPNRRAKVVAMTAFSKISPNAELLSTISTKIEQESTSRQWLDQNGRYIPYPAKWLNQRQWEDESPGGQKDGEDQQSISESTSTGRFKASIGAPSRRRRV